MFTINYISKRIEEEKTVKKDIKHIIKNINKLKLVFWNANINYTLLIFYSNENQFQIWICIAPITKY